ncbi:germination protein GerKC [Clostridium polyendosporum]|uniref:Germination protein GerKC n=1 Tax=Clostridium polyendosporum TaxID=69208 RepID=A0A919RXL6_9CLOT|nr:Ger(x)C family spore germination protein [Clostridium polyendosporum]GIM27626.1 germination protein GerKC [Clostridium polyendosporum]
MKKFFSILVMIITTFSIIGCKGTKQELEKLAILVAMGFDLSSEGKYMLTAQILNPKKQPSSSTDTKKGENQQVSTDVTIYNTTGDTPADALNHLSTELGKNLFFAHIKFLVYSERIAESGLSLALDSSLRTYTVRPDTPLFITKDRSSDIVSALTTDETIPANEIANLIKMQSIMGYSPIVRRVDFANILHSKTAAPVLGIISLNKSPNVDNTFKMVGTAVLKKDKLIGYLDINQTRGMQWVKGEVKGGSITVHSSNNKILTFEIIKSKSTIKPIIKNNSITLQITIKEEGNLREMTADLDPIKNSEIMNDLSKIQDKAIEKEIKLALDAAQNKLNADIFDFGDIIHRTYPDIWKKMEKNWNDIFPYITVEIKVNSSLKRPGFISHPIIH